MASILSAPTLTWAPPPRAMMFLAAVLLVALNRALAPGDSLEQPRASWTPSCLIFCCRSNPPGDSFPFLACFRLHNIPM